MRTVLGRASAGVAFLEFVDSFQERQCDVMVVRSQCSGSQGRRRHRKVAVTRQQLPPQPLLPTAHRPAG